MKTLTTDRLILRRFTMEDAEDFYEYAKDPDTGIHAGWKPHQNRKAAASLPPFWKRMKLGQSVAAPPKRSSAASACILTRCAA